MTLKLSHIALACTDMAEVSRKLEKLKLKVAESHEVPTEKVKTGMIPTEVSSEFRIELLEPTSKDSPIAKFLEKKPQGGIHHICFEVDNIDRWFTQLKQDGFEIIPPGIRPGARGKVLFIHPKSMNGVLVELEEIT